MDDNHPNSRSAADREYDEIKDKIPGLSESEAEESKDDSKESESDDTGKEDEAAKPDEAKPEKDTEDADSKEEDASGGDDEAERPKRPEKYIPVKQYTSEKKEWKERESALLKDIEDAKAAKGSEKEDAIKAYAEKHDVSEESVRELMTLFGSGDRKSEDKADKMIDATLEAELEEGRQLKAEKLFEKEFTDVALPELKKAYPDATDAQLKAARAEIEKLATTKDFLDKSLDFVVYKSSTALDPLFKAGTRKGPETGRTAPKRGADNYTADDFKGGKTDFKELLSLPVDQQTKIIEGMDVKTYDEFTRYNDRNDSIIINRGGRAVRS